MLEPTVIVPVRDFDGMTRLTEVLSSDHRAGLIRSLCARTINAAERAGLESVIISASTEVHRWAADRGVRTLSDSGTGLSAAAAHAVSQLEETPWIVVHADLPLVTADALKHVAQTMSRGTVLVPSLDGGTNVIASTRSFPFSFGVGSFHRHFAAVPRALVIPSRELSIDIDTPAQYAVFGSLVP